MSQKTKCHHNFDNQDQYLNIKLKYSCAQILLCVIKRVYMEIFKRFGVNAKEKYAYLKNTKTHFKNTKSSTFCFVWQKSFGWYTKIFTGNILLLNIINVTWIIVISNFPNFLLTVFDNRLHKSYSIYRSKLEVIFSILIFLA